MNKMKQINVLFKITDYVEKLGVKRKCIFKFSRKCKNHAQMG
jgi:hypothetical protein